MATKIANLITLDGTFMDWPAADMVMTSANTAIGYQVYGAFLNDATLGNTYVIGIDATASTDPVIGTGTIVYLNTDQNNTTGYNLSFANVGAEYEVQFASDTTGALQAYLYSVTSAGATTLLNSGAPLNSGFSSDGESVELAVPQTLLTPAGSAAPTSINFATLNGAVGLPGDLANNPEYIITDPAAVVPSTTIGNLITLDGTFSDWPAADIITTPANVAPGYQIYGAFLNDATLGNTYVIGIDATASTDPVIGPGATAYLNTDQNNTTGYNLSFANIGAEYEVQFAYGSNATLQPFLYSINSAGATTLLNGGAPLNSGFSSDGESVELAIPQALLTPAGGAAPTSINFVTLNGAQGLPANLASSPQYTITDTLTLLPKTVTHRVAIVYSDTTAANYFRGLGDAAGVPSTAYDDLFMAAQNQARMAGVSYDVIDESQLTNVNNLIGYDALIFPAMTNVNTAQLPAIMSALTSAVYDYHIGIITSGDFLTNDQTGAALPGNSYANMATLLGLARVSGGNSGSVTVTANDVGNPIMKSYAAGQVIHTYTNAGYTAYQGVGGIAPDVLVNQNVTDPTLPGGSETIPGVVETTTGGTNVHFATQALLGDSNLLSDAIQTVVLGTTPGVALHTSRDAGIVAARMDMDDSQYPAGAVTPDTGGPGIYDYLLPILQQWQQTYDFVGSYYVNIGDDPNNVANPTDTVWSASLPYYQQILAMGGEIGTHTYTHLINPPTTTFTAHTVGTTQAGSKTITLDQVPSFYGITVGMWLAGTGIGSNTAIPGDGGGVANTQVTAVNGNTITISYVPTGFGGANQGTIGSITTGTALTFSVPPENTNFLESTSGTLSGDGNPFTYAYEFGNSKTTLEQQLSQALGHPITIYGAAVPGAAETIATSQNILQYFPSGTGYTGYLTGGYTGIGAGYPGAFGYIDPTQQGSVYIAPNITFDFTEIQYQGNTIAQAEADWAAQFNSIGANAAGTPIVVWPIHDYGVSQWNPETQTNTGSLYSTQMYTDFIKQAYASNYEFVTLEDLASRLAAQQKAHIDYTTVGNTITVTVTPDPTAPDLGAMALDVVNDGTEVIQNVTNWYAYNATELFLPGNGGTFAIDLGTTQDDVTHIAALPMRGDLRSVLGDGQNLSFAMVGSGDVLVDLKGTGTIPVPIVTGATIASLIGDQLELALSGLGEHDVTITMAAPPPTEVVSTVAFSADTGASATDLVTNIAAQTITGALSAPLAAGDVVKVSLDNGATWLTATAATGATSFSLGGVTLAASNTLIARVENPQGLASTPLSRAYVLDQVPPTETAAIVAMTDDSGVAGDFITNNGAADRTLSGTLSAALATDETLQVSSDDGATWTAAAISGTTWSVVDSASHATNWTIESQVADLAGNLGPLASQVVTFDNTPPTAPATPDLIAASDNGTSSTDNITSITTPTFTGTAEPGSTVTLLDGTAAVSSTIADPTTGTWSITVAASLAAGVHAISATATDRAGNFSAASGALSVTIVTPPATPSTPDLIAASDSGRSTTDNITNVTAPTFKGTATAGLTVTLFDGTTAIGTGVATAAGAWQITSATLLNGVHNISAVAANAAGIPSAASAALAVTIDTMVVPASVPDMTAATDRGVSNTDNITNDATPTFTGTAEAVAQVTLLDGNTVIGTARATATGAYTITATTLLDGTHAISASQVDVAGNVSTASTALSALIDTVAPTAPTAPVLSPASDSGVAGDNITNNKTPTFTGTAEQGSTVTIFNGATKVGTAVASLADGSWSATASALANGIHSITAKATDVAGNVSVASVALAVTIDTVIATPSRPALAAGQDTGVSATDNITNINAPAFTGTADDGSTVSLFDGTTKIGAGAATGGTWTIATPTLPDGVHSITAQAVDLAGNVSAASAARAVTIDTAAPTAPTFSGGNATSLIGKGEAGATVTVFNGTTGLGSTTVGGAGNWSIAFIAGAFTRSLTAVQTDKAGNPSSASGLALVGTSGVDTITGTSGNDFMIGGAGADTFVFGAPFGNDVIADFAAVGGAHDIIDFHAISTLNSLASVQSHTTQIGSASVISDGSGSTLTLNNVTKASLTAANFTFV